MGFLDNMRSHFKNNDEEEFERAFRDPSWPVGVDDFEPMSNTGSFLPATYDIDPLADASLPGNALHGAGAPSGAFSPTDTLVGMQTAVTESVVRAPATPIFAPQGQPVQPLVSGAVGVRPLVGTAPVQQQQPVYAGGSPQGVPGSAPQSGAPAPVVADGTGILPMEMRPAPAAAPVDPAPTAAPRAQQQEDRPSGYSADTPRYDMTGDEGVQVYTRQGERATHPTPQVEQKPFADRLRERVAAANVAGQTDEMLGRSRVVTQEAPAPRTRRNENASSADIDAELEERRRTRRSQSQARGAAAEQREERQTPKQARSPEAASPSTRATGPVAVSCVVVRPRSYEDVREVAQGLIGEHRPVVMVLRGCSSELTRRILDFSFGLCCASNADMRDFGNHVYGVLPRGTTFTDDDAMALRRQGIVLRG